MDGYASFVQAFDRVEYGVWVERVATLISEGRPVGVHWVVTGDRRLAVPAAVQAALPQRLILRFNDVDEYDGFGLARAKTVDAHLPPGRGFSADADEVQVAVYGTSGATEDQARALHELATQLDAIHKSGPRPNAIQLLPSHVPEAGLPAVARLEAVPLGTRDLTFDPATIDISRGGMLFVGARRSGKSTALRTLTRALSSGELDVELVLLAPSSTPLLELDVWAAVHRGNDSASDYVDEVLLELDSRGPDRRPLVIVVDDGHELADEMADSRLAELVKKGVERGVRVLAAADKNAAHRAYGGFIPVLKAERAGVVLQPDPDIDGDLFDVQLERRARGGPPGRAAIIAAGRVELAQIATSEDPL